MDKKSKSVLVATKSSNKKTTEKVARPLNNLSPGGVLSPIDLNRPNLKRSNSVDGRTRSRSTEVTFQLTAKNDLNIDKSKSEKNENMERQLASPQEKPVKPVKQIRTKEPKIQEPAAKVAKVKADAAKKPAAKAKKPALASKPPPKRASLKEPAKEEEDEEEASSSSRKVRSSSSSTTSKISDSAPTKTQLPKPVQEQRQRFQLKKPNNTEEVSADDVEDEVTEEEDHPMVPDTEPEEQDEDAANVIDDSPNVVAFFCK